MDTRMIVFTLLCVTGLVLVTGQEYGGRGDDGRRGGGRGGGGRGGGGRGGGGGHGPGGCGPVCEIFCEHGNVPDANGCPTCRCNPPPIPACSRNGIWLGRTCSLGRTECGPGASCETTSSGSGICCRYPLPEIQCPTGYQRTAQTCSGMLPNNNQCLGAYDVCQGGPADGGVCCRPTGRPGTCPPPSSRFGICVVGPNHCLNDNQCAVNQKCCSEGCGRECKYVGNQYPPIPPIPTY